MILEYVRKNWDRLGLEPDCSQRLSFAAATPRFRTSAHVLFFIFLDKRLRLVIKVSRLPGENPHLLREAGVLRQLSQSWQGNVPRLLVLDEMCQRPLLAETALAGRTISRAMAAASPALLAELGFCWLSSFHRATLQKVNECELADLIQQSFLVVREGLDLSRDELRVLNRTASILESLPARCRSLVFEHGDFSAPNLLLLPNDELGVVDWELAARNGLPAADLFFFLTFLAFAREGGDILWRQLRAFRNAFFGTRAWARSYVERYAEALELPQAALPGLFVLTWLRYVAGLVSRLSAPDGRSRRLRSATTTWLRSNRYFQLWMHSVTRFDELRLAG